MSRYATGTSVSPAKSVEEIERELRRFGAAQFAQASDYDRGMAGVVFCVSGIQYRVAISLPQPSDRQFTHTPARGTRRSADEARRHHEQEVRRRWRALGLVLKAKLVAVRDGVATFEHEFLPYAVLASGRTVGDEAVPRMIAAARQGALPQAGLLGLPEPEEAP